jgi:hypothetical protein
LVAETPGAFEWTLIRSRSLAKANMINALKFVTIQRGQDPQDFTM